MILFSNQMIHFLQPDDSLSSTSISQPEDCPILIISSQLSLNLTIFHMLIVSEKLCSNIMDFRPDDSFLSNQMFLNIFNQIVLFSDQTICFLQPNDSCSSTSVSQPDDYSVLMISSQLSLNLKSCRCQSFLRNCVLT